VAEGRRHPDHHPALLRMDPGDSLRPAVRALVDHITDRTHLVETGTESYRFRRTLENGKARNSKEPIPIDQELPRRRRLTAGGGKTRNQTPWR
jgi:hypothetical protein